MTSDTPPPSTAASELTPSDKPLHDKLRSAAKFVEDCHDDLDANEAAACAKIMREAADALSRLSAGEGGPDAADAKRIAEGLREWAHRDLEDSGLEIADMEKTGGYIAAAFIERLSRELAAANERRGTMLHDGKQPTPLGEHIIRLEAELAAANAKFSEHTKAVESFLSDLYCTMVDPCADEKENLPIAAVRAALLKAAEQAREDQVKLAEAGRDARFPELQMVQRTELYRLREIEHLVWHCLDDSEERDGEQVIQHGDDFKRLRVLLPEAHPCLAAGPSSAAPPAKGER